MCLIYLNLDEIIEFAFYIKYIYWIIYIHTSHQSHWCKENIPIIIVRFLSTGVRETTDKMETTEHLCTILRCLESKQRMTSSIASWVYNQFVVLAPCQVAFGESSTVCPRVNLPDERERNFLLYVSIYSRYERINSLMPKRFCHLDDVTSLFAMNSRERNRIIRRLSLNFACERESYEDKSNNDEFTNISTCK